MKQNQLTLTCSENHSTYQKKLFGLLKAWGPQKFQILTQCFKALFTEEELSDAEQCATKAFILSNRGVPTLQAPLINAPPQTATYTPDFASEPETTVKPTMVTHIGNETADPPNALDAFMQAHMKATRDDVADEIELSKQERM